MQSKKFNIIPGEEQELAFIISRFPSYDETFILRELVGLKKKGLKFRIFSLLRCNDEVIHKEAKEFLKNTTYLPLFNLKVLYDYIVIFLKFPLRFIKINLELTFFTITHPAFFLKTFVIIPQAISLANLTIRANIKHLHAHWATTPATIAMIIKKIFGIPYSMTAHAHDIYSNHLPFLRKKIKEANFIITCTEKNKKFLERLLNNQTFPLNGKNLKYKNYSSKIILNYHGINLCNSRKEMPATSDKQNKQITITGVGSLLKCKGFIYLIRACSILRKNKIAFKCNIYGDGPERNTLEAEIDRFKLKEHIFLKGYVTQEKLLTYYREADILVLPAIAKIHWGISNVLIEAMAHKIAVITTNFGSVDELIEDGKTGLIVREKSPEDIAEKIMLLAKNEKLRRQLAENGYKKVKELFDIEKNVEKLVEVFNLHHTNEIYP